MGFGRLSALFACFIFVSLLVGFVSQRHFPRELLMRLKHLYYRTDNHRVSEWNCDTCDTLCRLQRSSIADARRILHEVNEAAARAKRVASGQSGTLRVGFVESVSWHGVVPDSFREFRDRQPDAELELQPSSSLEQTEAVQSGRLDAGFVFTIAHIGRELAQLPVASLNLMLA